jgi:DNA-binding transcriptional ArsR family regulator
VFAALADPTRRWMLEALMREGSTSVPALTAELSITRQAVAKHVAVLDEAGLLEREPEGGREVHYRLREGALSQAAAWIGEAEHAWEARLGRLKGAVEKAPPGGYQRPQPGTLLARSRSGTYGDLLGQHLDGGLRAREQVLIPAWMLGCSTLRGDDHPAVAVGAMNQRCGSRLARVAPHCGQQENRGAAPVVAVLATGFPIDADMLGPEQIVVRICHSRRF